MLEQAQPFAASVRAIVDAMVGLAPSVISAVLLMLLGWLVARGLRALTLRSGRTLNRGAQAIGLGGVARDGVRGSTTRVLGNVVYWLVMLFFLTAATRVLGLVVFASWLDRLAGFLPNILSGCLIIFAGVILANIAKEATEAALPGVGEQQRLLAARAAQGLTLTLLLIVGLDQMGIDITVVSTVLAITVAAFLGGLALAFSLGARTFVSNVIGAHYLGRDFAPGQRIRFDGAEGVILEITSVAVVIDSADGRSTIPAHLFAEKVTMILNAEAQHG